MLAWINGEIRIGLEAQKERERDLVSTRNDVACVVHPIERFLVWPWQGV